MRWTLEEDEEFLMRVSPVVMILIHSQKPSTWAHDWVSVQFARLKVEQRSVVTVALWLVAGNSFYRNTWQSCGKQRHSQNEPG